MTKREIKLTAEFKAQTAKAIISIIYFAFTYVLMLVLSVGLTALCIYAGIMLIAIRPMVVTIALGIGLASLGILVLIFLLKFMFKSHKIDRSHLFEISKANEPELFALIAEIVKKVGTSFPKKVYLSTDVNAAVFYDSNFWSMIFPVRKNLQIGMGLVNTVSKTELTAILSHEFGHFSQKTMKVGSYVYNVNQVIYNLLYDNASYENLIQSWSSISGYFSIFVMLAVKIIEGIQWILRSIYTVVNKNYLGLSREMEFHADEIAASVTGFEPLKNSLLRLTLADQSLSNVLSFYEGKIASNQRSENVFKEQAHVMNFLAKDKNIPFQNDFPMVTVEELNKLNKSKLVIKDQWASHPSTDERIERLEKTNFLAEHITDSPANEIFTNIEECQKALTNNLFQRVTYQGEVTLVSSQEFQAEFQNDFAKNSFSKIYNGYYDNKNPLNFEIGANSSIETHLKPEELFSDQKVELVYTAIALQNDIETLKQIGDKNLQIKTFDYDGKKYKTEQSVALISKLSLELDQANEAVKQNDINIYNFLNKCEQTDGKTSKLELLYREFFDFEKRFEAKYEIYTKMSSALQFINLNTPFDLIRSNFRGVDPLEIELKSSIKELLEDIRYQPEITQAIKESFELYLSKQWLYFGHEQYYNDNLDVLFTALNNYAFLLSKGFFSLKKELLKYQEELLVRDRKLV
jgi:Zn-dependent protease with chaperone function